jgi:flavin-dependent dehydrogenase
MTVHDLVVVGGGPAGSTAAAIAARAGLDVVLLEAGTHPRPHVGESLLPGVIPILAQSGALAAIEQAGFARKTGSTHWNWGTTPRWDLWFCDGDAYDHAWLVDRARFDATLFKHAGAVGADVRDRCPVRAIAFEGDRAVGARWHDRRTDQTHDLRARFVIDATGSAGLVGRSLAPPVPIEGLQHQAMWAHFDDATHLPAPRSRQALFVAEADQWWWCFPLGRGRSSVGVVQLDAAGRRTAPRRDFDALVEGCAEIRETLGPAAHRVSPVRHERDWSYRCPTTAGPGWFAVGDAAGFIDPVLSTGVMLALHSAYHAASTVVALCGDDPPDEAEARQTFRTHHAEMFDDLLRIVRFFYRQNLHRDAYFWESKAILAAAGERLRPQKAFVMLTSGLVDNLALDGVQADANRRRKAMTTSRAMPPAAPDDLGFVCLHLRHDDPQLSPPPDDVPVRGASVFVLVEPTDPAAAALFRTKNFDVNAIAPRHGNDPISVPALAPVLRSVHALIDDLDTTPDGTLAAFWRDHGEALKAWLDALAPPFSGVRIFGE